MDKISIIVPVYNVSKYIRKCLDTIINQTYTNLEIILIDDGSTDNSGKICDEYAKIDSRIKVIHKENGGISSARNAGIKSATGKYIGFVDSDDWIDLDMYNRLYNNLKNENAEISCCNRLLVYSNKQKEYGTSSYYEVMNSERAIELMCTYGYIGVSAYTKLYEKKLFKGTEFPTGKKSEDVFIMYKLFDKASTIVYDATPLYYYRQREGSITSAKNINLDIIDASKEMMVFVEKKYPKIKSVVENNYVYSIIGVYDTILKSKEKGTKIDELKKFIMAEVRKYYQEIKRLKINSKSRKMQLIMIRYIPSLYSFAFKLYNLFKGKTRKIIWKDELINN